MIVINVPADSWELLEETLLVDAASSSFDPKLRKAIKRAMSEIVYLGDSKDDLTKRLGHIRVKSEYSDKSYLASDILAELANNEISSGLESALSDLLHAGRI